MATRGSSGQRLAAFGLINRDPATLEKNKSLCEKHVLPLLGGSQTHRAPATEVETWLSRLAPTLSFAHPSRGSSLSQPFGQASDGTRSG